MYMQNNVYLNSKFKAKLIITDSKLLNEKHGKNILIKKITTS